MAWGSHRPGPWTPTAGPGAASVQYRRRKSLEEDDRQTDMISPLYEYDASSCSYNNTEIVITQILQQPRGCSRHYMHVLCNGMYTCSLPVVGVFIVHPHEMFFESVDLGFTTDYPIVVHYHAVGAVVFRRKDAISFLEVVQATQIPVPTYINKKV